MVRAIDEHGGVPVRAVHPVTHKAYFVVSAEQYERLKPLFEDDPRTPEEQRFLIQETGKRADWDEPKMDAYDRYDEHRAQAEP